ncbi:WG repeat-containing protein [Flavobacterium sp. HSC-61S13]|uniref:WG repeat-containing protein n=1 Tax=Flavobacterium sp. HSC-61S13 TaxID=2910963 RepID=UPI00209D7B67|nr:WG repeat-containing protein [Flavobacterium sp. HSC-61S13]MCP1996475.1 hypothetical protein [Flavobacterium sp. HSC-61S13]
MYRFICLLFLFSTALAAQENAVFQAIGKSDRAFCFAEVRKDYKTYLYHTISGVIVDDVGDQNADMFVVIKDGYYGIINTEGRLFGAIDYDDVKLTTDYKGQWYRGIPYDYKFAITKRQGKYGIVNGDGGLISIPQYDAVKVINKNIIGIEKNGKWGWISAADGSVLQNPIYDDVGKNYGDENAVAIYRNGKAGLALMNGAILIEPQYRFIGYITIKSTIYHKVQQEQKFSLIDTSGRPVLAVEYEALNAIGDAELVSFKKGNLWGLIDLNGKEILPPVYTKISDFTKGLSIVEIADKKGVINAEGKFIVPLVYDNIEFRNIKGENKYRDVIVAEDFYGQPTEASRKKRQDEIEIAKLPYYLWVKQNGKVGLLHWNGTPLTVSDRFTAIEFNYQSELLYFKVFIKDNYGVVDKSGREILPVAYHHNFDLYYNTLKYGYSELNTDPYLIPIFNDNQLGLYHLEKKRFIIPLGNLEISWLSSQYFVVRKKIGDSYKVESALYDRLGQQLLAFKDDVIIEKMFNDKFVVVQQDNKFKLLNLKGQVVYQNPQWDRSYFYNRYSKPIDDFKEIKSFDNSLLKINGVAHNLFIDENGREKQFTDFVYVSPFYLGYAWVAVEKEATVYYGIIDLKGQLVVEPQFEKIDGINDSPDLILVRKNQKYGIIKRSGKRILDTIYDYIDISSSSSLREINLNGKSGLIDREGTIVVEPVYDELSRNYDGIDGIWPLFVKKDGWYYFLNQNAQEALPRAKSKIN